METRTETRVRYVINLKPSFRGPIPSPNIYKDCGWGATPDGAAEDPILMTDYFIAWVETRTVVETEWITEEKPSTGDTICQECKKENPVWFAPDNLWNVVVGTEDNPRGEGIILCPSCFCIKTYDVINEMYTMY